MGNEGHGEASLLQVVSWPGACSPHPRLALLLSLMHALNKFSARPLVTREVQPDQVPSVSWPRNTSEELCDRARTETPRGPRQPCCREEGRLSRAGVEVSTGGELAWPWMDVTLVWDRAGCRFWLHTWLAVWSLASYLTLLSLSFLVYLRGLPSGTIDRSGGMKDISAWRRAGAQQMSFCTAPNRERSNYKGGERGWMRPAEGRHIASKTRPEVSRGRKGGGRWGRKGRRGSAPR